MSDFLLKISWKSLKHFVKISLKFYEIYLKIAWNTPENYVKFRSKQTFSNFEKCGENLYNILEKILRNLGNRRSDFRERFLAKEIFHTQSRPVSIPLDGLKGAGPGRQHSWNWSSWWRNFWKFWSNFEKI